MACNKTKRKGLKNTMQKPNIPKNEVQRLQDLKLYNILDTAIEPAFEDITKLAAQICGMPISLISLVDKERQWFKSHYGLHATETSRDVSFCAHAINDSNKVFIVPDAHDDDRFADNPLVMGYPNIGFYAGVPLISPKGQRLGTLCVIDNKENNLTPEQTQALELLSKQVIHILEYHKNSNRAYQHLRQEKENYSQLFAFPKGANCDLVSFKSELHSVSTEGDHKDVELSYEFSCNEPSQLKSITINAFNRFSELENLYFEAVINNKALTKSLKSGVDKVIF